MLFMVHTPRPCVLVYAWRWLREWEIISELKGSEEVSHLYNSCNLQCIYVVTLLMPMHILKFVCLIYIRIQ